MEPSSLPLLSHLTQTAAGPESPPCLGGPPAFPHRQPAGRQGLPAPAQGGLRAPGALPAAWPAGKRKGGVGTGSRGRTGAVGRSLRTARAWPGSVNVRGLGAGRAQGPGAPWASPCAPPQPAQPPAPRRRPQPGLSPGPQPHARPRGRGGRAYGPRAPSAVQPAWGAGGRRSEVQEEELLGEQQGHRGAGAVAPSRRVGPGHVWLGEEPRRPKKESLRNREPRHLVGTPQAGRGGRDGRGARGAEGGRGSPAGW